MDAHLRPYPRDVTSSGAVYEFLRSRRRPERNPSSGEEHFTHTSFAGGKFHIDEVDRNAFHAAVAKCLTDRTGKHEMLPLTERHTMVFPFYIDIDLEVDAPVLADEVKVRIAALAGSQVDRFYASAPPQLALVCDKSRPATQKMNAVEFGLAWTKVGDGQGEEGDVVVESGPLVDALLEREGAEGGSSSAPGPSALSPSARVRTLTPMQRDAARDAHGLSGSTRARLPSGDVYRPVGRWKHGLHVHWPHVLVSVHHPVLQDASMVGPMLGSICNALKTADWGGAFGTTEVRWEDACDNGVYDKKKGSARRDGDKGLRMIGAPKASECGTCRRTDTDCSNCKRMNNGKVIDFSVYKFLAAVRGGERGGEATAQYASNVTLQLRHTTVRSWDRTLGITDGWGKFVGCPEGPDMVARGGGGGAGKWEVLRDPACLRVAMRHLRSKSEHYGETMGKLLRSSTNPRRLALHLEGNGATYCLNKQADHARSKAYMEFFQPRHGRWATRMRCFCRKSERRFTSELACFEWKSLSVHDLTDAEAKTLGLAEAASARGGGGGGGGGGGAVGRPQLSGSGPTMLACEGCGDEGGGEEGRGRGVRAGSSTKRPCQARPGGGGKRVAAGEGLLSNALRASLGKGGAFSSFSS